MRPDNGMPEADKYKGISAKEFAESFNKSSKSAYIYTIMAQPLKDSSPPFCLTLFGLYPFVIVFHL